MKNERVLNFRLHDSGTGCEIEARDFILVSRLSVSKRRSVVSVRIVPKSGFRFCLDRVVLEDGHIWAEHPVCLEISGSGAAPSSRERPVRGFEGYYAVLEGCAYESPIRGEVHYQTP